MSASQSSGEGPGRGRMVLALDPQHRLAFEDHVELDLPALGLVVLGELAAGSDLDQVETEGRGPEGLAGELPGGVTGALHRLELVAMLDRVAGGHRRCDHTSTRSRLEGEIVSISPDSEVSLRDAIDRYNDNPWATDFFEKRL